MSNIVHGGSQDSGVCVHREGRRPSIVEMISSGEVFRLQGDSADQLDFSGVPVGCVEQIYNDFERPDSDSGCNDDGQFRGVGDGPESSLDEPAPNASCFRSGRWWNINPTFGSPIIESYWKKKVIEFLRRRYKIAVSLIGLFALIWVVFFSIYVPFPLSPNSQNEELAIFSVTYTSGYIIGAVTLLVSMFVLLALTFSRHYPKCAFALSILLSFILMACSWALPLAVFFTKSRGVSTVSFVAQFALTSLVIVVMYTLSRLPLWLSTALGIVYIVILEVLISRFAYTVDEIRFMSLFHLTTATRCMFYVCLIVAGLTTAYLSQARLRATFTKIAQCVLSEKALELEKQLAETTILTMMPKPFADELCKLEVQLAFMLKQQADQQQYTQQCSSPWLQSIPTPFTVRSVDNVSILFADIVGFTQLSSNMKAVELVGILDEIFSTFDELVTQHHCEKVNTLGDCYFCISGCPEPEVAHADNCVHMGLAILEALKQFRAKTAIPIEMRIGIHTGSVLCGVMGNKRFKFDVWSKDVSIANRIEALCLPGHALISETTRANLLESFHLEELSTSNPVTSAEQLRLFTVQGLHNDILPVLLSSVEQYGSPHTVETLSELESQQTSTAAYQSGIANRLAVLCCPQNQEDTVELELRPIYHSDSIVDIFSRQSQIQKCRSYAELSGTAVVEATSDSDRRIVQLMEEGNVDFESYFNRYLKLLSLQFHDSDLEKIYHNHGRDLDDGSGGEMAKLGLRLSKQSYLMDTCALLFIFVMVMTGTAITLSNDVSFQQFFVTWLALFLFGLVVELTVICHVLVVFRPNWFPLCLVKYVDYVIMNWYVRTLIALFFIYYPMAAVFVSISHCSTQDFTYASLINLTYVQTSLLVTVIVLVSSILFMDTSHIVKMIGGIVSCVTVVVMTSFVQLRVCDKTYNISSVVSDYYSRHLAPESVILLFLILIILTVVNRMSEVSVRVSFLGCVEAAARRRRTRQLKSQAEWLLHNIIPPHVARRLREVGHFSQNHECVGVLFASIVNFNEYYEQSGETEESYRVLNRIVSKFDSLLDLPHFQSVEKIKTIGSTYMAASGLNLPEGSHRGVDHLVSLIDFAIQLEEVLKTINRQTAGFAFSLRVGFNYGTVTSGVVGRRKMLYDIWGDVVNVASRMETTGLKGRIQMPEQCLALLSPFVVQLGNRTVQVKGKGDMRTVFVTRCS